MQQVITALLFDGDAQEALDLYTSVFRDALVVERGYFGEGMPFPAGTLLSALVDLGTARILLINGGEGVPHTHAASIMLHCDDQAEIDWYWERLSEGGTQGSHGWLADRFGVWWQVVPASLGPMLLDSDRERADRVMAAMLRMTRFDIAALERAYAGA